MVKATLAFLENTSLAADAYERRLLNRFIEGGLTIAEVLELLEEHNKATQASTPNQRIWPPLT
jgi:hypothetical protein